MVYSNCNFYEFDKGQPEAQRLDQILMCFAILLRDVCSMLVNTVGCFNNIDYFWLSTIGQHRLPLLMYFFDYFKRKI